jgi:mono/diheme cytochrome c family protein
VKLLAGFVLGVVAVALAGVSYVYSGFHNVAAVEPHAPIVNWAFTTTMQRSVIARAQTITPPPIPNSQKIGEAFQAFDEMCVQCHGAPGKEPSVIGKGLQPLAPVLGDAAHRWKRAELFWIVKNGIKMTGMPAFGPTHSDEQIWLLVAFLQRFPNITSAEYKEMEEKYKRTEEKSAGGASQGHQHGQ